MLKTMWYCKHKWIGHVLWHDGILCDILEGRMLGKSARGRRRIQLVDDLLQTKNYADLKEAAKDRSVWRTIRRGCHKPAQWADHYRRTSAVSARGSLQIPTNQRVTLLTKFYLICIFFRGWLFLLVILISLWVFFCISFFVGHVQQYQSIGVGRL